MIVGKIFIALCFIVVSIALATTWWYARRRTTLGTAALMDHRKWAERSVLFTVGAVLVTESFVRANDGIQNFSLFIIHLCFAIPFFVLLMLLVTKIRGFQYPQKHKIAAYLCIALFVGTITTGTALLLSA